ncbi:MAG: DUF1254 domain-containing protein [Acidobacteria bacterium]|nr:DUF1254 domain-containing protein [Acidobacteriota bacterium]
MKTALIPSVIMMAAGLVWTAQAADKPKMATQIPPDITTPDSVETRLGTLRFFDGLPDKATVEKVYDNLDFMRGVDVFLNTMAAASTLANIEGLKSVGCDNFAAVIHEDRVDARTLLLTPNTQTATLWAFMDLKAGPLVVEIPPGVLGLADDAWMRYVIDLGLAGPDKGKGGRYLFLPPGYKGEVPEGYFVARPLTYKVWFGARGFSAKGDTGPAVKAFKDHWKVYPLGQEAKAPKMKFINGSGLYFNTIHSTTFKFYEEVNTVVQEEPADSADPEILGQLAAIGIVKGKPFAPDARMKKILTDAAAVGNATARALSFKSRDEQMYFYPGKSWFTPFVGGSHEFIQDGVRLLDARTVFFYVATGISPAMAVKIVGGGSQYACATFDAEGNYFDGGKNYRLRLPPNVPVKTFWSIIPYDTQTRSVLQTDQRDTALTSESGTVKTNDDGSTDIYFSPKAPPGKESNWIQTMPGKGWFTILRLYGALEPWFDQTWRPGEIERVR